MAQNARTARQASVSAPWRPGEPAAMTAAGGVMLFIGVSTGGSFINSLFPRWAEELGLDRAELLGLDLPLEASAAAVGAALDLIARERRIRGALVTSHKIAILSHGRGRFASLDFWAGALAEVSAITKVESRLHGHALDPIVGGEALDRLAGPEHWRDHPAAVALIMGAGGAGVALAANLLRRGADDRPATLILTDVASARLDHARRVLGPFATAGSVRYARIVAAGDHDALLDALPAGSLVVNATGLGKDRPGSPLSDGGRFPAGAVVWELNYRGERRFLRQAQGQAAAGGLRIADGWSYFVLGWSRAIALVFGLALDAPRLQRLETIAAALRDG
jgi:shikimate dehydrogenase